MEKSMIYTKSLSVGYSGKVIIDGIEISVNSGEILTLIGPNGAGKSTILKTICRQLQKISGAVYINGKESGCFTNRELAKTISILMTERVEPEMMTCGDVVKSGRYPYTGQLGILSENDKIKVMEAMKLTSVDELADKSFNCISVRELCLQGQSVRSRNFLFLMSLLLFLTFITNSNFSAF